MTNHPSYSLEEARDILLEQSISLESHIYLEGRREEYVRAEDYDRPAIVNSSFRHIWSVAHSDWDWDKEPPADAENEYYTQRDVSSHPSWAASLHMLILLGRVSLVPGQHSHTRSIQAIARRYRKNDMERGRRLWTYLQEGHSGVGRSEERVYSWTSRRLFDAISRGAQPAFPMLECRRAARMPKDGRRVERSRRSASCPGPVRSMSRSRVGDWRRLIGTLQELQQQVRLRLSRIHEHAPERLRHISVRLLHRSSRTRRPSRSVRTRCPCKPTRIDARFDQVRGHAKGRSRRPNLQKLHETGFHLSRYEILREHEHR